MKNYKEFEIKPKWVTCKCPACERIFKRKMIYSGTVMPRFFCKKPDCLATRLEEENK